MKVYYCRGANKGKNRIRRWVSVYFPEYKGVYTLIDSKGGLAVLKEVATPDEIVKLGVDGIIKIQKEQKLRANGRSKATKIVSATLNSIGLKEGLESAKMEIRELIEDYELHSKRLEQVNDLIKKLCLLIKNAEKLLEIKSIGILTVAGFIAEC